MVVAEVGPRLRTRYETVHRTVSPKCLRIWSLLVVTSSISLQTTFVYAKGKSDLSLIPLLLLSPKRLSPFRGPRCRFESRLNNKKQTPFGVCFGGCGGRTRTYDLRVMSPTSFQLLYSAIWSVHFLSAISL